MHEFGQKIEELMKDEEMRNFKLILMNSKFDEDDDIIDIFGLKNINQRIWQAHGGLNVNNHIVYVISEKHKVDVERILVSKVQVQSDNHIFVFWFIFPYLFSLKSWPY